MGWLGFLRGRERTATPTAGDIEEARALGEIADSLLAAGRVDEALEHYREATQRGAAPAGVHANYGALLRDRGALDTAIAQLERALELDPQLGVAAFNLALLRLAQRQWAAAATLLRQSLAIDSRQADAQYWLGNALMGLGDAQGARAAYAAALRLDGNFIKARWGHAMAQLPAVAVSAAEQDAAQPAFAAELQAVKSWLARHRASAAVEAIGAQQPYYLAYIEQDHRAVLERYGTLCTNLMADWARQAKLPAPPRTRGRITRVGIVSAHIHHHSVWHALVRGWLEHLDPKRFEIQVFHTGVGTDAQTQWAARQARLHRDIGDWSAWARTIADARCDVLLYPEIGMDATTARLSALRLAPAQAASWGHPVTTGLPTMDAFISAAALEPPDAQAHYTEKLIALPRLGCAYRRHGTRPDKIDLAAWNIAPEDRLLVCAGSVFKYAPARDDLFVQLARRCGPCKLLFFGEPDDLKVGMFQGRLRAVFSDAGLEFDRSVRFLPWLSQERFFALLARADVFLDSAGFSGFNTAMQAIECGIPIVAWEGRFMRGRLASGILRTMGLDEWVADSVPAFVEKVHALCDDTAQRRARDQLRQRRDALFDDRATVDALAVELERLAGRA